MSAQPRWRPLPVSAEGLPNFLIATDFAPQSYSVTVTDLTHIWTETMDRKSLVRRGLEEDISIDLTDGADQIARMLDYLQAAFDPAHKEHKNASLKLSISDDGETSLMVHITCILPKVLNLKPLQWSMTLKKKPDSAVAASLVLPLVRMQRERAREVDTLVSLLRDKDSVIARLVDKLEASGTGLEHVFATLAGKRKVTRRVAEERVKGLAPFTGLESGKEKDGEDGLTDDVSVLLDGVFGGEGLQLPASEDLPTTNDWWTTLGKGKEITLVDRARRNERQATPPGRARELQTPDDDEFQVQSSPPSRSKRRVASSSPVPQGATGRQHEDPETEDSDEVDAPPSAPSGSQAPRSRIGTIGGRRHVSVPSSPPPPQASSAIPDGTPGDSDTASDTDEDQEPAPSQPRAGIRRIGGIGGIGNVGGGARNPPPPAQSSRSDSVEARGRPRAEDVQHESTEREEPKVQVRETSTERADRKRRELRREQEARAAAGPAKKKRRF